MVDIAYNQAGLHSFTIGRRHAIRTESRLRWKRKSTKVVRSAAEAHGFHRERGWKSRNSSPLSVEGQVFSLTSPFIEQAIALTDCPTPIGVMGISPTVRRINHNAYMRVLLVEDDDNTRKMIAAALRRIDSNGEIEGAINGDDGLARYNEHRHDLVVTDHIHPGCYGIELIRLILARSPLQPAILQTGNRGEHIEAFKREYPTVPVLEKGSYTIRQFHDAVRAALSTGYLSTDNESR